MGVCSILKDSREETNTEMVKILKAKYMESEKRDPASPRIYSKEQ